MSPQKGRAGASKRNAKAALVPLAAAALKVLSDPETREAIAERGKQVVDWASERRADRADAKAKRQAHEGSDGLLDRFGQRGLERRAAHARRMVTTLGSTPEIARRLDPVVLWLDSVDRALLVASGLPLRKRKKTHRAIDGQLDDVEELLLELTLPGTSPVDDV